MGRTAIVAGTTGLIGRRLVHYLLAGPGYEKVKILVRKAVGLAHPKLEEVIVNWDKLEAFAPSLTGNDVYCCLGTTMNKAKDKVTYRRIDLEYPLALAGITRQRGATFYGLVSSMGADVKSSIFYSRLKAETEEAIASVGFDSYHIARPSMLLGDRSERRIGESIGKAMMKVFDPVIPGRMKAIDAGRVAKALVHYALRGDSGRHTHLSDELQQFV